MTLAKESPGYHVYQSSFQHYASLCICELNFVLFFYQIYRVMCAFLKRTHLHDFALNFCSTYNIIGVYKFDELIANNILFTCQQNLDVLF